MFHERDDKPSTTEFPTQAVKQCAEQDGISMNQFIATAVAEKLATLATMEYLEQRAPRGGRDKFDAVLARVPDVKPQEDDAL